MKPSMSASALRRSTVCSNSASVMLSSKRSKVLLKPDTLDKLQTRGVALQAVDAARTLCVTINPVSAYGWKFDKDEFRRRMSEAVDVPVINVKEALK